MLGIDADPEAIEAARGADLLITLGSSLVVQPAASIPLYTLDAGGEVAIINDGPTPLDARARYRFDDLETCFQKISECVQ